MHNPFPEEMNRVIVDAVSDLNFVPTARAFQNLLRAGI
jgi:UDP-N-acetylglucosamine 2-epimerase